MQEKIQNFDNKVVAFCQRLAMPFARLALFVIYFWFGLLKIIDVSPANPLVMRLQEKTLPFLSFQQFIVFFALFEMLIGLLFLFPKATRLAIFLFFLHMLTTFMPLVFLPGVSWQKPFVPTLEGQYIIKNLALIALVIFLAAELKPSNTSQKVAEN
ncbi:MAG: hypothetical protein HYZ51_03510 [Candidatus Doudnabacteria bacterium]|nr:hypothetical protein [Candidatus Doudnabacteria bacterium]